MTEPTKPRLVRTPIRLDRTLHRLARAAAKRDGRSFNQWVVAVIKRALAEAPKPPEASAPPPALG